MIFRVEVDVALARPPRADATIYYEIDAPNGHTAELIALEWAYCHPRVSMPVRSVVTDWPEPERTTLMLMTDAEIAAAIAAQEEHIKRSKSCRGEPDAAHAYRKYGNPNTRRTWSACVVCGVTETQGDHAARLLSAIPV